MTRPIRPPLRPDQAIARRYSAPRKKKPTRLNLALPQLSRDAQAARELLAAQEVAGSLPWRGEPIRYREDHSLAPATGKGTRLALTVEDRPLTLWLGTDILQYLPQLELFDEDFAALTGERLALVAEHLLGDLIEKLENQLGAGIALRSIALNTSAPERGSTLDFHLDGVAPDDALSVRLGAPDLQDLAARMAKAHPPKPPLDLKNLILPVSIVGPLAVLARSELRNLSPGAVYVPVSGWPDLQTHAHILLRDRYVQALAPQAGGFILHGEADSIPALKRQFFEGSDMSQTTDTKDGSLGNPVTLITIELERKEMTLAEIETLRNGSILSCDADKIEEVTLCADGVPFARGRLVQLEDGIGVQIVDAV